MRGLPGRTFRQPVRGCTDCTDITLLKKNPRNCGDFSFTVTITVDRISRRLSFLPPPTKKPRSRVGEWLRASICWQ
jgi:hypothetical protein